MAFRGIIECYESKVNFFGGVCVTDGGGRFARCCNALSSIPLSTVLDVVNIALTPMMTFDVFD
jgi:hypothetical protein